MKWRAFSGLLLLMFACSAAGITSAAAARFLETLPLPSKFANGSAETQAQGAAAAAAVLQSCSENYGLLPCSTSVGGNLVLMVAYGFMLLKAAQLLSEGSDMLLAVVSPGIIGGLLLPVLGASPDALLILVSGAAASKENAQSQILVGMGLLAGSTVMLLTLVWGICIVVGRCDLQEDDHGQIKMKSQTLTDNFNLFRTGVSTDSETKMSSWIMMATILPFFVVQGPKLFGQPISVLFKAAGCTLSIIGFLSYCIYQVLSPWLQERRVTIVRERYRKLLELLTVQKAMKFSDDKWGNLINPDGSANKHVLAELFSFADIDKDGTLTESEVQLLVIGLGFADGSKSKLERMGANDVVERWFSEFDSEEKDHKLSKSEFIEGMSSWIESVRKCSKENGRATKRCYDRRLSVLTHEAESSLHALLKNDEEDIEDDGDEEGNEDTKPLEKKQLIFISLCKIAVGAALAGVFADPLTDAINHFSTVSGIPNFFVSFVATPFATNFSEAFSSVMFARKKRRKHCSLAYSQIYGSVIMNNTLCLGVFLLIVLLRKLAWEFSSEVLVIVLVTLVMGSLSGLKSTFPLWMAALAFLLYPAAIALVIILDYVFGWQ